MSHTKIGVWIQNPKYREWDYCSICKIGTKRRTYGEYYNGTEWVHEDSYLYCPWCGAELKNGDKKQHGMG